MPRQQVRPGDVTGREKARLERENADALAARAKEITLNAQVQSERDSEPVDLTNGPIVAPTVEVGPVDLTNGAAQSEIEVAPVVEVTAKTRKLRVNDDLEQVTIGAGQHYDFEQGREYIVPAHIYDHLEEKGYVWH